MTTICMPHSLQASAFSGKPPAVPPSFVTKYSMFLSFIAFMLSSFEKINVISYEGQPLEISCSGKYLQDALKAIDSDEVTINFSGELKPMVVKKEDDDSLIQLISPVRTYH